MRTGHGAAHGKAILLGEHSVVHGRPALAAGIDRGVVVIARDDPGGPVLEVEGWELEARPGGTRTVDRAFAAFLDVAGQSDAPVRFVADSRIPLGAGLGSSAALFVAAGRALADRGNLEGDEVVTWATEAEKVFHGTPSGIDVSATSCGGLGRFDRTRGWEEIHLDRSLTLVIGRVPGRRRTRDVITHVQRRLSEERQVIEAIFDRIGSLVESGLDAIDAWDLEALGQVMSSNHESLCELGVSTPGLDELVAVACKAGACGAKMTGAGGGGSVIALAPGREASVLSAWDGLACESFVAAAGP